MRPVHSCHQTTMTTMSIPNTESPTIGQKVSTSSRMRAFRSIERTAALMERNTISPKTYRAFIFMACGAIATILSSSPPWLFLTISASTFIFGYVTTLEKTWKEVLYTQLAKYSPADPKAYHKLQEQVRNSGSIQPTVLNFWKTLEGDAVYGVGTAHYNQLMAARERFINNSVEG